MPVDYRRITGPEDSYPPSKFAEKTKDVTPSILKADGKRSDGRLQGDARPFCLKAGIISQAKGSAYVELGKTKVICAVYGPREIAKRLDFRINGQIYCDLKFAPFASRTRRQYQKDGEERDLSQMLKQALEPAVCLHKFPKAQVDIFVVVLDNDGGALSGAITAAGVALANAGIPMYDVLLGCSLHCSNEHLLLDATESEENEMISNESSSNHLGNVTLGLMPSLQQVTSLVQDGAIDKQVTIKAIKSMIDHCHQLHPIVQQTLLKSWKQEMKERLTVEEK